MSSAPLSLLFLSKRFYRGYSLTVPLNTRSIVTHMNGRLTSQIDLSIRIFTSKYPNWLTVPVTALIFFILLCTMLAF